MLPRSLNSQAALLLLALHLLALSWFALANPHYTWDLVPYVATSLATAADDPAATHEATYRVLRQSLDSTQYNPLIGGEFAAAVYASPENFTSQLDMYRIKPLYVAALRGLTALGANPVDAIIWLSLAPGLLICVILFCWLRDLTEPVQAALVVILFSIGAQLFDLSRTPTPDNLSALAVFGGVFFLLARHKVAAGTICLCLSVWIRGNNIVFAGPLFLLLCWNHYCRSKPLQYKAFHWYGAGLAFSVLSCLGISAAFDYDWWRLYYHTFVAPQVNLNVFDQQFSLFQYLDALGQSFQQLLTIQQGGVWVATNLPLFLLLWLFAWRESLKNGLSYLINPDGPIGIAQFNLIGLIVITSFLLFFPQIAGLDRFLTATYAIATVWAIETLQTAKSESR